MAIKLSLKGVPGVNKELLRAANRYQSKALTRKLIRPAAVDLREELKKEIVFPAIRPSGKKSTSIGRARRSIRTFSWTRSRGVHVGPRVNKNKDSKSANGFHFGWHDKGTKTIKANNFIDKTLARVGDKVSNKMVQALISDLKYLT